MQAPFQGAFPTLPTHARGLAAAGIVLMHLVLALLVAPTLRHRLVERGDATHGICRFVSATSGLALLPFAVSLGIDVYVGVERVGSRGAAALAGAMASLIALYWWYAFAYARRIAPASRREDGMEQVPLHIKVDQMLTEARVILPGAQAMLGFQLAIMLTQGFDTLAPAAKLVHAMALGLIALSVILLMAPAAYHRIAQGGEDSADLLRRGGAMVVAATVPLALGMCADIYVVIGRIAESPALGMAMAALVGGLFAGLWYLYPLWRRGAGTDPDAAGSRVMQDAGARR